MKKLSLLSTVTLAASILFNPLAHASQLKVLWYIGADAEEQSIKEALAAYTAKNPETTFDLQIVPYDGIEQKFSQFVASGTAPDITKTSSMRPIIRPYLVDLKEHFGPDYLKDFVPGWAMGAELGDQVIAAPLLVTATGILLNKSAFDKAGIAIPPADKGWTWDEFLQAIKTVQEKAGVRYPLVWDVSASRWIIHEFQYGNHIYSEEAPYKVVMDDAKWTETLDKFIDITKNYMPPGQWSGSSSDNPKQLFTNGQAVAWMSGSWQVSGLAADAKFDWQAGPTPYGTVKSSIFGGDYVMAFNTGEHIKEATDFIKWLTSPEGQAIFCKAPMYIPANLNTGPIDTGSDKATAALAAMQKELADSPTYAATDQGNEAMQYVWDTIKQSVVQAVTGQLTSAEAVAKIHKAADESLEASK
ncbi:ABC-type sugar transport system, periplasmic component [uncultured Pleomorphomonas sp.]|uniref:Sugar ABC transporter substrate-binding protein n=2 Tax=Pleomorphomonas TaxID=261933 RepID=A0A2G9X1R9_9HYPH|nr:extracellular solute-binding protein [Pleomorphomonas carboxyditropha]PIP00875.1 sugar ABC transporter substrate-binding protein [Pleomorphomonas carboxyditropha]SCM72969.1 ABC-type sugar transport system, periplasmic component [uncultured Pleomorphomonas sp.]